MRRRRCSRRPAASLATVSSRRAAASSGFARSAIQSDRSGKNLTSRSRPTTGRVKRRFGEIKKDDRVPLMLNGLVGEPQDVALPPLGDLDWVADFRTRVPRRMTPELAEFVGYFMGDGSLHAKGLRLCVAKGNADVVERLVDLGAALFNES